MTHTELIESIETKLAALGADYSGLDLRQKVLRLADIFKTTRNLNINIVRASGCDASDARERIRLYFIQHVEQVLDAIELAVVSGISEYGKRTRELRVQDGYKILTGSSNDPESGLVLKPSQYVLIRVEPDATAAKRWHIANRIRKRIDIAGQDRILQYFQANVGQIVTSEEIAYVANKVKDYGRRARELRTEEGFAVTTRFTGRPDLRSGEYVLESIDRVAEPHDRHIQEDDYKAAFKRDDNTCRICGWKREMWKRENPRLLELHHFINHAAGGANVADNLLVLCNVCHDNVHAERVVPPKPVP